MISLLKTAGGYDAFGISPVVLDDDEMRAAVECGKQRMARVREHGWQSRAKEVGRDDAARNHALGAAGEIAFAKWLGVPFVCTINTFSAPDVAGFQVRTTRRHRVLKVHPRDHDDHRFVLVVWRGQRSFEMAGWITGADGKVVGLRANPGDRGEAFFVQAKDLREMAWVGAVGRPLTTPGDTVSVRS